jgi:peptidoglycan/LPS O-acetylase OafA/YrhL
MGLLRLVLASLVMLSHMGISIAGVNPGVSSVIVFYMLAGHVVSQLWTRRPAHRAQAAALWFYQDRLWRIMPLYLFAALLAAALWALGVQSPFIGLSPHWYDWLANLLIIPLNFYMYTGQDGFTLLPPAWSLAVELQFYLLVPLLLCRPPLAVVAAVLSFAVFILAQCGVLNTDVFGYRLLGGVGFVFLAGTLLGRPDRLSRGCLGALWLGSVIYVAWLLSGDHHQPYNTEVALGFALGLPLLVVFFSFPRKGLWQTLQRRAGELSYGVFLLHFPAMWLLQMQGFSGPSTAWMVFVLSALLAWLGHATVERPLWKKYRLKLPVNAADAASGAAGRPMGGTS